MPQRRCCVSTCTSTEAEGSMSNYLPLYNYVTVYEYSTFYRNSELKKLNLNFTGVTLHGFPNPNSDRQRFMKWVANAGLAGEDEIYIFKNRRICRLHFENIYHYPKNRLCRLSVPRLMLSCK